MTLEQQLHRGSRAKEVLENEIYIEAFETIEKALIDKWKNSPARDQAGRESIYLMQTMLQKVQMCLRTTMETGMLAQQELRHKQTLRDQAAAWIGRA